MTDQNSDRLELRYIPLVQATKWDDNPKKHALDALVVSIETHGFGDPPKFDATLGALVYGNGRTEALERMRLAGKEPPRGVAVLEDGGWAVPVIFGVDAESRAAAVAFAIDHNNLGLMGGNIAFEDMLSMWDEEGLKKALDAVDSDVLLASFDDAQLEELFQGPSFDPVPEDEQPDLGAPSAGSVVSCPECGHEWEP